MKKILIAEDNHTKLENIIKILKNNHIVYETVTTYCECWNRLEYDNVDYSALILDMSLPRYINETAYKFAGYDILKRMYYYNINLSVIIITGHVQFTIDRKIFDLNAVIDMIEKNDRIVKTKIVHYDNKSTLWQNQLLNFLNKLENKDM